MIKTRPRTEINTYHSLANSWPDRQVWKSLEKLSSNARLTGGLWAALALSQKYRYRMN